MPDITVGQWQSAALQGMKQCALTDPETDIDWMLCDALKTGRGALRYLKERVLTKEEHELLEKWLAKRLTGCPLQYAQQNAWYMGHAFWVDERVLIPRFDTEILCEEALKRHKCGMRILDMCTGSGCLAVSMALADYTIHVTAADISEGALEVAKINAKKHAVPIDFRKGDLFEAVEREKFDMIVCNPPYLTARDMTELQTEVQFEPETALFGGEDGLDFYRRIAKEARDHLTPGGWLLVEIGAEQGQDVQSLFAEYENTEILRDLAGHDRVVTARMPIDKG